MPPLSREDIKQDIEDAVSSVKGHIDLVLRPLEKEVKELRDTVYGPTNDSGLKIDVDRLKQQAERQTWATRALGGGLIAGIISSIVAFFKWVLVSKP
jgi:hypothetical protein